MAMADEELTAAVCRVIEILGIEAYLASSEETSARVASMYRDVFSGTTNNASEILAPPILVKEEQKHPQLVMLSSVHFFSMCQHHFLPFYGFVDIGYVTGDYIIGLGKITRLVETLTRRPQLQESLTNEIAFYIEQALQPMGIAVHVIARHLCEAMRGTRENNQILRTFRYQGILETEYTYRNAFLASISRSL